jgi:polyvinyl alcohol dehydrogenase (cytochrome)
MFLQMLSGPTIYASLTDGIMQAQAAALTPEQRQHVAEYLAGGPLSAARPATPIKMCEGPAKEFDTSKRVQRTGWGYDNRRLVAGDDAGLDKKSAVTLELKWAFEFPGALRARSQPAIAFGAVYVGSHDGHVYALDLQTGCARWAFKAGAEVRTAIVPYEAEGGPNVRTMPPRVMFGDLIGRVYSVEALTGHLAWSAKVDDHPHATLTGTPRIDGGMAYIPVSSLEVTSAGDPNYPCCSFRGAVVALDAWSGDVSWRAYSIEAPPTEVRKTRLGTPVLAPSGAPVWNSPVVDRKRGLLYVGTGENYSSPGTTTSDAILAFHLSDGKLAWSRQTTANDVWNVACMMKDNPNCPPENGPDVDFGAGVMLTTLPSGKDILIAGQKNGVVYAFDPDRQGDKLWQTRVGRGGIQGGIHFGMAMEGTRVYAPVSDMTDGRDGRPVDGPPRPGLYALDAASGKPLWATPANDVCRSRPFCDPGISAAISAAPGLVFAGHMDGRFRAYDGDTGAVLFEFDTTQELTTVSGAKARGGSFGGAGPAIRDGYVVVNSGYGLYFHMPGNVLLAFGPKGR